MNDRTDKLEYEMVDMLLVSTIFTSFHTMKNCTYAQIFSCPVFVFRERKDRRGGISNDGEDCRSKVPNIVPEPENLEASSGGHPHPDHQVLIW